MSMMNPSGISDLQSIRETDDDTRFTENGNPPFGERNLALTMTVSRDGQGPKRRRPKNNIVKSSSSFVSRVIVNEIHARKLHERNPDGLYVFANINRAFQWLDYSSKVKHEPLTKILFTKAHMLCHDVNEMTKSTTHLDVVMGSSASDIIWYEPMQQKYARLNKNGLINSSPVSHIKWIPGSETLFMAAHHNGSLVVYDKEKEDAPFTPEDYEGADALDDDNGSQKQKPFPFSVLKSVNSNNQRTNPVAYWKISNHRINNFAFSPDHRHLAVVQEDGSLRIIDYLKEK